MCDTGAAFVTTVCFHTWQNSSLHNTNIIKTGTYNKHQNIQFQKPSLEIQDTNKCKWHSLLYFLWPYRIAQFLQLCQLKNQHSPTSMPSTPPPLLSVPLHSWLCDSLHVSSTLPSPLFSTIQAQQVSRWKTTTPTIHTYSVVPSTVVKLAKRSSINGHLLSHPSPILSSQSTYKVIMSP